MNAEAEGRENKERTWSRPIWNDGNGRELPDVDNDVEREDPGTGEPMEEELAEVEP